MKNKDQIEVILQKLPKPLVGSFGLKDRGQIEIRPELLEMMEEIYLQYDPRLIFEIGTHSGYSSAFFLSLTRASIISVDIGHTWIEWENSFSDWGSPCPGGLKQVVQTFDNEFPHRFHQVIGDSSNKELKEYFIYHYNSMFDMCFIDGNHEYSFVVNDIKLARDLGCNKMLIDDFQNDDVRRAVNDYCKDCSIKEFKSVHNKELISVGLIT